MKNTENNLPVAGQTYIILSSDDSYFDTVIIVEVGTEKIEVISKEMPGATWIGRNFWETLSSDNRIIIQ